MALEQRPDIETLALAIARSPIMVARAFTRQCGRSCLPDALPQTIGADFPEGFEDVDLAILRWIVEQGRRTGRRQPRS
jgi:hypothetical protein